MRHEQRIQVSYDYPVYFVEDVFAPGNPALMEAIRRREPERAHRAAFVVDSGVARCFPALERDVLAYAAAQGLTVAGPVRVVPGGEACKNDPDLPAGLARWFDSLRLDRQSFVVAVGGGSVLDMVGYAAAVTHRGLRLVRIPTTVLAQNDSGVGVKNGVNALGKKNFYGTFAPPFAVLCDSRFLSTLEPRDRIAGMAEAVKVSLVKDAVFFRWLEAHADRLALFQPDLLAELVRRCAVLHLDHIASSGDPFELGSSRPLDFGHWAGHKLESLSGYSLRHGEAVAVGIALDTRYSVASGLLPEECGERVLSLLEKLGLPTFHPELETRDAGTGRRLVLAGIEEFREHLGGELTLMMLRDVGSGTEVKSLDPALLEQSIGFLRDRSAASFAPSPRRREPAGHPANVGSG